MFMNDYVHMGRIGCTWKKGLVKHASFLREKDGTIPNIWGLDVKGNPLSLVLYREIPFLFAHS